MTDEKDKTQLSRQLHNQTPSKRRKKKKLRKLPFIVLILLAIMLAVAIYVIHSYRSGLNYAKEHAKDVKVHQFNGPVKNDGKISVLVLGADQANGGKSRSDSIMVVQYDYIHKKMKMMSVMRDIYAEIPGYQNYKINAAYSLGGPELLRQTLNKNLGVNPEYYAVVDFTGFEKMIDELEPNGVPINVEKDMSENIGVSLKKGRHRLNGKELLGYARFRHDEEGDFGRVRRQQQVMQTLKQQLVNPDSIVKLPKVAGILRGYVNTNIPNSAIFQTGVNFGIRGDKDVQSLTVPVKNSYQDINTNNDGSALDIDKEKNKQAIKEFFNE
ncbi:LytR family transcriptional regulator [Staphylococcus pragensis]|uniref:Regulatory protein MsrR n=1 Tax=Staphylococcus pragensis TaxID=1611836 RepID=A0A4Z1BHN1_9STAP|nr:LCP family protein [Staphylococcus pragensis]RTX87417.1 LytR family transcriptional regulator [Staphylococcus carnosus]TGN28714.1 LytR family transcriptional regulator [Staphylococcus pragensis]GGG85596.1 LytR family transcriptional regulator [Staphylococcus pragensis]